MLSIAHLRHKEKYKVYELLEIFRHICYNAIWKTHFEGRIGLETRFFALSDKKIPESVLCFMRENGLHPGTEADFGTVLYDNGRIAAAACRSRNVLKYFAIAREYRGENLTAVLMTELQKEAFRTGIHHLFLYTHPENDMLFAPYRFYPVAETDEVLLMENKRNGARDYVQSLPVMAAEGRIGAIVMHADPFTRGHRYLAETAASQCQQVYVFVLSEERGFFRRDERLQMVRAGCRDLTNVTVYETGPYLVSSATFPDYFLKQSSDRTKAQCALDSEIFIRYFAPHFHITDRYVGTEPDSAVTNAYNEQMKTVLVRDGIRVHELERLRLENGAAVSASAARCAIQAGDTADTQMLLPDTTIQLINKGDTGHGQL